MATDSEAAAAGFSVPSGSSLIRNGDDAIRQNARNALDLHNTAKFVQSSAGIGGNVDALTTPGAHGYWSDWANRPSDTSGNILVFPPPTGSGASIQQVAVPYGTNSELFYRFRSASGNYSAWQPLNTGKFVQSSAGIGGDVNTLTTPGAHGYWSDWANRPSNTSGSVLVFPPPAGSGLSITQIAFPYGSNAGIFQRFAGASGTFSGWTRLDAGAETPDGDTTGGGISPSALKSVPLALTAATATGETTMEQAALRWPIQYGAPIGRWRVHVRNYNYASGKTFTSGGSITGLWFGPGTNGAFASAPSKVGNALTIDGTGADTVTPWISTPIEPNTEYVLSIGVTSTAEPKVNPATGGWVSTSASAAAAQSATGFATATTMPFDWWIEAETVATTPTVAAFGDSITAGTGTDRLLYTSWISQYARKIGALPIHYAYPGSGMVLWMNTGDQKWHRWNDLPNADAVIHFMGQNDLGSATTAAIMRERFETTLPMIREHISPNVYVATITPHTAKTEEQNAVRRAHTAYLRSLPLGVRDVFDFSAAVSSDDIALKPEYRGGPAGTDELHPNAAGGLAMANTITRPVVNEPAEDVKELKYDSGKRLIPLENGWTCYQAVLRRQGSTVSLYVRNMTGAAATSDTFLTMPTGFRDNAVNGAAQPVAGLYPYKTGGTELTLISVYSGALQTPSRGTDLQLLRSWATDDALPSTLPGTPA